MPLLCLLLAALPEGPYVRWIDVKGDVHVEEARAVLDESPSEVRLRMPDGSERTVPMARVLDLVRENRERPEERELLDARRDAAAGMRADAARKTLDRLARDGAEEWIREYAAAARALLAEQAGEDDAATRLARFLEQHPRSRFACDCVLARARIRARGLGDQIDKIIEELHAARLRVIELEGPIGLRCRLLRDAVEAAMRIEHLDRTSMLSGIQGSLAAEMGEDYGATVILEAEAKWTQLLMARRSAEADESAGRQPRAALHQVRTLKNSANLDLPEVRSDIERELGRLMLVCGDKEGARGAWERARDLAPDPRRREAAEESLKRLADAK